MIGATMQLCRAYIYVLLAFGGVFLVAMGLFSRVEFLPVVWRPDLGAAVQALLLWGLLKLVAQKLGRRPLVLRIGETVVEGIFLIYAMANVLRLLDHATKTFALPLADPTLAGMDQMLGLSWLSYFEWIHAHPAWHGLMEWSYDAINSATAAVVLGLVVIGQGSRAKAFVEAFVICALISIVIGSLFPARAAVDFWVADLAAYTNFTSPPGVYHLDALTMLRAPDGPIVIGTQHLVGLVTFPSLHTGIAVLIMLAAMRTWLWVPAWAYGLVMITSTPIWGGHYFVDLIGGTVMAVTVWLLVMKSLAPKAAAVADPLPARGLTPAE